MTDTTEIRECPACGETKPLDKTHWVPSRDTFRPTCRTCFNAKRREQKRAKEAAMTDDEWRASKAKEHARAAKYRKTLTPEQKADKNRKDHLRTVGVTRAKQHDDAKFLSAFLTRVDYIRKDRETGVKSEEHRYEITDTWTEFYETVSEQLKVSYGCDFRSSKVLDNREYSANFFNMIHAEIYRRLNFANSLVKWYCKIGWEKDCVDYPKCPRETMSSFTDSYTEDEIKYIRDYMAKPKREHDDLTFMSPAARSEFWEWADALFIDGKKRRDERLAAMSDEERAVESIRELILYATLGPELQEQVSDLDPVTQNRIEMDNDTSARSAHLLNNSGYEQLTHHDRPDLVRAELDAQGLEFCERGRIVRRQTHD